MSPRLKQIGLILLLGLLLPMTIFSFFEVYSLNQNEAELTNIYEQQTKSIIFAANQYTDDIVQNWLMSLNNYPNFDEKWVNAFLNNRNSIDALFFKNMGQKQVSGMGWHPAQADGMFEGFDLDRFLKEQKDEIGRLERYFEADYQKKLSYSIAEDSSRMILMCMVGKPKERQVLCLMFINIQKFAYEIIGPRLQKLASDQFFFMIKDEWENGFMFYTHKWKQFQQSEFQNEKLWILPRHQLYIFSQNRTIKESVKARSKRNLGILLILDLIMIIAVVIIFRNIRRELRLSQYKADFVSSVSHELRTPLALIRMFAETLEMKRVPTEEKKEEYYRIIRQESERLSGIVNKILNFSEMDSGKKSYFMQPSDMCSIVKDVMGTYEYHLRQKGFSWDIQLPPQCPQVAFDEGSVSEAMVNLIDNAIKYSDDKKHIVISVCQVEKEVGLRVTDQGIGISEEHQKEIFERFFRVTRGDLYTVQGTGLGLSLVKEIMTAHKGRIELESKAGEGSSFTLWFPVFEPKNDEV
ncbi:MAG: HAMP domain-containing sensor histidine kinase [Bacteroidota bacterium]